MQQVSAKLASKTPIGLDQHAFKDIAPTPWTMHWAPWVRSSDSVLSSWPYQLSHFYNFWSCWVRKTEGAESSTSCTQHTVSPCVWYQHTSVNGMSIFAGKWDSALKGNSALRAHVARAMGIELAHSEGQFVIHFLWNMRKFYDSIKAHLLIPQLVARGYPLEILVLGTLTHKSPRCLQVGNSYSNITMGCASSILAGCLQSCSWARSCSNLSKHLGTWSLVRSAKSTSMICHILLRTKAACNFSKTRRRSARQVKVGTADLGLTLSCKINASGKQQIHWEN